MVGLWWMKDIPRLRSMATDKVISSKADLGQKAVNDDVSMEF